MAERSRALDSSSGVVRMWVRIPAWPVAALVTLSKTLNHNCSVLPMGRKAVGPVCCVMHVKEPRTLIVKEKGLAPVFLDSRVEHPAGWICARYKSSVLLSVIRHIQMQCAYRINRPKSNTCDASLLAQDTRCFRLKVKGLYHIYLVIRNIEKQ